MKLKVNISPKAKADIVEIWDYTARVHGPDAADSYVTEIDRVMILASQYSEIGSDYSDIRQGYRKLRSGSHLIFYIPHDSGIEIIRVLHQQADIPERLAD
jgi:toxin ParE1/3/4